MDEVVGEGPVIYVCVLRVFGLLGFNLKIVYSLVK